MQIWIHKRKNYPMKEFRAIFSISSILVIRSGYAKKYNFLILAVIQNIWDLHKFGLQIWIQNAKITLWKNFGAIIPITSILVIRSAYAKKGQFSNISCISKCMGFTLIWVADLNSECKNYPMKEFLRNFSGFIDFGHQVRVCKKISFLNITCNSKYMGLT